MFRTSESKGPVARHGGRPAWRIDQDRHDRLSTIVPHFHAYYEDQAAAFALDTIECLGGSLPKTQQRLVEAWAEIHRDEPIAQWAAAAEM
jgi:hypothetical protein